MADLFDELERKRKQNSDLFDEVSIAQNQEINDRISRAQTVQRLQQTMTTPEAWLADIGATLSKVAPNFKRPIGDSDDPEALETLREIENMQDILRTAFPSAKFSGDVSLPGATAAATVPMGLLPASLAGAAEAGLTTGSGSNPKIQAAIAGAAPAAISAGGKLISGGLEFGQNLLRGGGDVMTSSPTQQASRYMGRYMDEAGLTPEEVLLQRSQMGEGSVLADVPSMRGLSQDVATEPAGRSWIEPFKQRLSGAEGRILDRMSRIVGKNPDDFTNVKASAIATRKSNGRELYKQALFDDAGNPISIQLPPTRETNQLLSRLENSGAFEEAKKLAEIEGVPFTGGTTISDLHQAKIALGDMSDAAYKAGNNARGSLLDRLKDQLVSKIEIVSPQYKVARVTYADDKAVENAIDLGESIFRPKYNGRKLNYDEAKKIVDGMSAPEFNSFQIGVTKAIRDKLEGINETADSASKLWQQTKVRNAIMLAFKEPEQFQKFMEELKVESAFTDTLNDLYRGSQTAQRNAAKQSRKAGGFGFKEIADRMLGREVTPDGMQKLATMMFDDKFSNQQIRQALIDSGIYDENLPLRAVGYMRRNFDMTFDYYNDKLYRTGTATGIAAAQGNEDDQTN